MTYEKDLFISYAHLDNQPLSSFDPGWVTRFHTSLDAMLSMRIGSKAEIWRDQKLRGNDFFADEIVQQFSKTAVLVSVLSPRYSKSDWCAREVREFCAAAEKSGGLVFENKARVIKVIKTPTESEELLPAFMRQMLGYEFYTFVDEAPLELDPAYGPEIAQKYNLKVAKLAWDLAQFLKKLRDVRAEAAAVKPAIYLAECSYDKRDERESIERELRQHGYRTLPEGPLPGDEAAYAAEVARLLTECNLSIHLVGSGYGAVKDGPSGKSVVVLQNELAIQQSAKGKLKRAIWLQEGTVSSNAEQTAFINALQRDPQVQAGADLISAEFETFKGAVHAALSQLEAPQMPATQADAGKLVYLICAQQDRDATRPLRKFLRKQGLSVEIPLFEGAAAIVRQANDELLKTANAAIVFYGSGDETWYRMAQSCLKKANAYRSSPLPTHTCLSDPASDDKRDMVELEEPNIIDCQGGFSETRMEPVLRAMNWLTGKALAG